MKGNYHDEPFVLRPGRFLGIQRADLLGGPDQRRHLARPGRLTGTRSPLREQEGERNVDASGPGALAMLRAGKRPADPAVAPVSGGRVDPGLKRLDRTVIGPGPIIEIEAPARQMLLEPALGEAVADRPRCRHAR